MRLLIEVLHIAAGLIAASLIAAACAWSYPLAQRDIWHVAYGAMAAILLMGVAPMRRAFRIDRARLRAATGRRPADG
jgi:hypothetical protein